MVTKQSSTNNNTGIEHCVLLGGGRVGQMLATRCEASGISVTTVDLKGSDTFSPTLLADAANPTAELANALQGASVVILALPEQCAIAAVAPVASHMPKGALLVDTVSVKSRVVPLLKTHGEHLELCSINPLFAPELDAEGRTIAYVRIHGTDLNDKFERFLSSWGANILFMDAETHDRTMAMCQTATHAAILSLGIALANGGTRLSVLLEAATPPHLNMLAMFARIICGNAEVYFEIQNSNPYSKSARETLVDALNRIDESCSDVFTFEALFDELRTFLGGEGKPLAKLSQQIFDELNPRDT